MTIKFVVMVAFDVFIIPNRYKLGDTKNQPARAIDLRPSVSILDNDNNVYPVGGVYWIV